MPCSIWTKRPPSSRSICRATGAAASCTKRVRFGSRADDDRLRKILSTRAAGLCAGRREAVSVRKPFRILSLAGGGYLGMYTACVLAELEERAGEPLARRFDLIAGTSVGGILAIALGFEMPMQTVKDLFLEQGTKIF